MSEDRKGFTVNDRRHFTPDGCVRATGEEVLGRAPEPARPTAVAEPPLGAEAGAEVDFGSFLLTLAGQASVLLGLAVPEGEKPNLDLKGARSVIAVLEMLQAKTEGRRTPEEDQLLEGLLYELRMAYVARARSQA
jgi:hypothetical protein